MYEPTKGQRFRQVVCSKGWAICILMAMGTAMIAIAVIAAFARPGSVLSSEPCSNHQAEDSSGPSGADLHPGHEKPQTYIATNGEPFPWKDLRLPVAVIPEAYTIFLHANISKSYFEGRVEMTLDVVSDTNFIVFHSQDLNISDLSLYEVLDPRLELSKTRLEVTQQLEYPRNDQYYVRVDRTIKAKTQLELHVNFRGSLESVSKMKGFYKSEYIVKGSLGKLNWI